MMRQAKKENLTYFFMAKWEKLCIFIKEIVSNLRENEEAFFGSANAKLSFRVWKQDWRFLHFNNH